MKEYNDRPYVPDYSSYRDFEKETLLSTTNLMPAYNSRENNAEDKKAGQIKEVYENLHSMEEKLGYIINLFAVNNRATENEDDITGAMRQASEEIRNDFVKKYIKDASPEEKKKVFRAFARIMAEQEIKFNNDVREMTEKVKNNDESVTSEYELNSRENDLGEVDIKGRGFYFAYMNYYNTGMREEIFAFQNILMDELDEDPLKDEYDQIIKDEKTRYFTENNISENQQKEIEEEQKKISDVSYKDGIRDWVSEYGDDLQNNRQYKDIDLLVRKGRDNFVHKGLKNSATKNKLVKVDDTNKIDRLRKIYDSLDNVQDEIEFLVKFKIDYMLENAEGLKKNDFDYYYTEMLSDFLTKNVVSLDERGLQDLFNTINNIETKYHDMLTREKNLILETEFPENDQLRDQKADYILKNSSVEVKSLEVLNDIAHRIGKQAYIPDNRIKNYKLEDANIQGIERWAELEGDKIVGQKKFDAEINARNIFFNETDNLGKKLQYTELGKLEKNYVEMYNLVYEELCQFRNDFAFTQKNAEANRGEDSPSEGSAEYQAMVKSINKAIDAFKQEQNVDDIISAINIAAEKSNEYHQAKIGTFGGPRTENGIRRFDLSESFASKFSKLTLSLIGAQSDLKRFINDKNIMSPEYLKKISDLEHSYNMFADAKLITDGIKIPDMTEEGKKYAVKKSLDIEKEMLFEKLDGIEGFDKFSPNIFAPGQPSNVTEAARIYIVKKFVDRAQSDDVTIDEMMDMRSQVTGKEFDKTVEKLSKNAVFKDLVKKNPEQALEKWKVIELKSEEIRKRCDAELETFRDNRLSADRDDLKNYNDALEKDLPDTISAKIISTPSNEALRNLFSQSADKEKELREHVKTYVNQVIKEANDRGKLPTEEKRNEFIKDLLNDNKIGGKILSSLATKQKSKANIKNEERIVENDGPKINPM